MSAPTKGQASPWLSYLIMGLIVIFGVGSAAVVLHGAKAPERESVRHPVHAPTTAQAAVVVPPVAAVVVESQPIKDTTPPQPQVTTDTKGVQAPPAVPAKPVSKPTTPRSKASGAPAKAASQDTEKAVKKVVAKKPVVQEVDTELAIKSARGEVKSTNQPDTKVEPKVDFAKVESSKSDATSKHEVAIEKPTATSKSSSSTTIAETKSTIKPVTATPVAPSTSSPSVVAANGERAWVKLDEQKTVIVSKGETVPGLGAFHGADAKGAKFDSGLVPVTP